MEMVDGRVLRALELTDNGYYSINKALSYGRPAIIQTGPRGGGKSTTDARLVLFDFIYNGHQWLYTRRQKDELDLTKRAFFDEAIEIINSAEDENGKKLFPFYIPYFTCEAGTYKIVVRYYNRDYSTDIYDKNGGKIEEDNVSRETRLNKEMEASAVVCGKARALNDSQKMKSGFFAHTNMWWLLYDEFIAEEQTAYLGNATNTNVEYKKLISIYASMDRGIKRRFRNEVRLLLIGNLSNLYNPILLAWNVHKYYAAAENPNFIAPKGAKWVMEVIRPSEQYIKEALESNIYGLMTDEERAYNLGNRPRSAEYGTEFIKDVPKTASYISGVYLNSKGYGIYRDAKTGDFYINKFRQNGKTEALDIVSYAHGDAVLLCQSWNKSPLLNVIHEMFVRHKLYFNNKLTQVAFLQYLDFVPR